MAEKFSNRPIRFLEDSVVMLDSRTRSILVTEGLPEANPLFSADPAGLAFPVEVVDVGEVLLLGLSLNGDGARIGIGVDSGVVWEYRPDFDDALYVSKDIEKFRDLLRLFEPGPTFRLQEGDEDELDVWERITEELGLKIAAVDSSAFVEGDSFWGTILMEIGCGDWSEEGIYVIDSSEIS